MNVPVWRVLAYNAAQMAWTVRSEHDSVEEAREHRDALRHRGHRACVRAGHKAVLAVTPPINNETRAWRLAQAQRMSDLADDRKRYKSPG